MLNKVVLMGRIGTDVELKQTPSGKDICSFSLAVQRNYSKEVTDWINIVCWGKTAIFVSQYFQKGRMIALEGSIQTRNYTDKDGNKRTAFEVVADQVYFADAKQEDKPAAPGSKQEFSVDDFEEINDDSMPF